VLAILREADAHCLHVIIGVGLKSDQAPPFSS